MIGTISLLLSPRRLGLRNQVFRSDRRNLYLGLATMGGLFWIGLFCTVWFLMVQADKQVPHGGQIIGETMLGALLGGLFILLAWSNVITALSTLYLADDLDLLLSLPVRREAFHYARLLDTLFQSSWMMALFGVPVFLAYGFAQGAPWPYYVALLGGLGGLVWLASNMGVTLATVLVNVFSARRTREFMVLLGLLLVVALFVFLRVLRPERLVEGSNVQNLAQYLSAMRVDYPLLFPPRWVATILEATLSYRAPPLAEVLLLSTGVLAAAAIARWTTAWGFDEGWARSQEAKVARFHRSNAFDLLARVAPVAWRPHLAKELRVFFRDPSQWSQVFLLLGICAIYLVTAHTLPVESLPRTAQYWLKQVFSFMNLGMGGFIMAAVAGRFQYPAVSREGRAWWVTRAAPVVPIQWLRAKAVLGFAPMLVVGQIVIVGSGLLLDVRTELLLAEAVTGVALCFGISGLAVSLGALWPDFQADTAARAATGPGAVFFMVVAQVLVFFVLAVEIVGAWLALSGYFAWAALCAVVILALCAFVGWWPMQRAADALWARGL